MTRFRNRWPLIVVLVAFLASHLLVVCHYGVLHDPAHSPDTCIVCSWVKALASAVVVSLIMPCMALIRQLPIAPRHCFHPIFVGFTSLPRSPPRRHTL